MGQGSKKSLVVLGSLVVVALGWASGCGTTTATQPRTAGDISLAVPFDGARATEVGVTINGEGMESPIEAELELRNGLAMGFIDGIEAGVGRRVVVTAYDASGELCSTETDVEVAADLVTPVRGLSLECGSSTTGIAQAEGELRTPTTIASAGFPTP
jgi:hypothetical protein